MCCSGNNTLPIRDCTFNGKTYKDGEQVEGICVNLICRSGQWASTGNIDECCRKCNVKDDPHFVSYDGVAFDFHGTCNYSITQEGVTQNPPFGVFGDFRTCLSSRSCVDATTFKDNENTIISMTYAGMANVAVNGNPFTVTTTIQNVAGHPVLAWRVGDCIRFLGTQRWNTAGTGAWRQVYLYAHPALTDRLYGLCGHYNYYTPDDLTHRDLSVTAPTFLPNAFGNSWKTSVQADSTCLSTPLIREPIAIRSRQKRQDGSVVDPCWNETYAKCYEILSTVEYNGNYPTEEQLQINSMFCATDLCAFKQAGNNQSDIDGYIRAIIEMLKTTVMYDAMATPGAAPIKDVCLPCLGTCGDGGNCRFQCDSSEEEVSGWCPFKKCKCCKKKPTCEDFTCGEGGTCRSCSCMEGEEVISGQCPMEGCLCCKKKPGKYTCLLTTEAPR
ncbi:hypothetical protein SK128_014786 [Halocaridina rubra]|uniref:VWFD domain-containing protein n=1 Tax=Halocaridina rubra TaxID=373956 RepID=A0AAN8X1D3_HALRR